MDSFGFEDVTLVKIDVEHHEDAVLAGSTQTILANRPIILIEILGGENHDDATGEQRASIDATIRRIESHGYRVERLHHHDYIATPE